MGDIRFPAPAGQIGGILEMPRGEGPWPSIVVLHDVSRNIRDMQRIARKIASHGYVALAPDLYSRGGRARCVTRVMVSAFTGSGRAVDDILAARDYLLGLPETTSAVGVVGFCMGGGFAIVTSVKGFGASAPFYGNLPRNAGEVLEGACPIVASFGERDWFVPGGELKLRKILEAKGVEHDVQTYGGVAHSFANQLPLQPIARITGFGYSPEAEAHAWQRVYSFFGEHLRDKAEGRSQEAK